MTNNPKMAPHVAAAIRQTAATGPVQAKMNPVAPPIPRLQPPVLPHGVQVLQMKGGGKKAQERARAKATRVLGDFQAYGTQQYAQRLRQLMRGADCVEKTAINMMVTWIMSHPVWSQKENLGHQSQRRGAPMHPDTTREVGEISSNMESWITKKYG